MNAVHTEFRRLRRQHPHLSAHQALVDARRAERELRQYRQYLESGRVTISFIEAKIPASCPHCCGQLHGWQITAALGGIEDHHHADSASYLREVRRELALEAGVIEQIAMLHRFNLTMDYTFAGAPISARRIRAGRPADEAAVVARLRATGFTQFHAAGGIVTRYGEAVETFTVFPHDDHGELYVQGARGADLARLVKTNRGLEVARTLRLIGAADLLRRNALALGNSPAEHYPDPQGAPAR